MNPIRILPATDRERAIASLVRLLTDYCPGKPVEVSIRPFKRKRTNRQNAALFGVAYPAVREQTGEDVNRLHWYACGQFFGWKQVETFGKVSQEPVRTTTTDENGDRDVVPWDVFSDFYAAFQREMAGMGIDVPDPDPEWRNAAA